MRFAPEKSKGKLQFFFSPRHVIVPMLLVFFASFAPAQPIQDAGCPAAPNPCTKTVTHDCAVYANPPLVYPLPSDEYTVQYLDGGVWKDATVYISKYGGTDSSPYLTYSGYTELSPPPPVTTKPTSLSFVSIPAGSDTEIELKVIKRKDRPFLSTDGLAVRPIIKGITPHLVSGDVRISTRTQKTDFAGEQFILYWDRNSKTTYEGGGIQGLVFFLNPPYSPPTTNATTIVKTIGSPGVVTDLVSDDFSGYNALDFEGTVVIDVNAAEPAGGQALVVPSTINEVYLGEGAWVQGKLAFQSGNPGTVTVQGPGVLDASRFEYANRLCSGDQGYPALNAVNAKGDKVPLDNFDVDGIIISDNNYYATGSLKDSKVHNVKVIAWNGNNDGLEFGSNTTVSHVFVRSGDDSLKMWGDSDTVTDATVWQNYNGGVVNLGWFNNSHGENDLIDDLYVVKTDWFTPTAKERSWKVEDTNPVAHQNNAVIASMMVPGTMFGLLQPALGLTTSLFENIYVEDPPQVLFSLKIVPPRMDATTDGVSLMGDSVLNLNIRNVFTPPSTVKNSIGFDTLKAVYTFGQPVQIFNRDYTLTGAMNINLNNVFVGGVALTSENAATTGKITTRGNGVTVVYNPIVPPPPPPQCTQYTCF